MIAIQEMDEMSKTQVNTKFTPMESATTINDTASPRKRKRSQSDVSLTDLGTEVKDMDAGKLRSYIALLEERVLELGASPSLPRPQPSFRYQVLYRILSNKKVSSSSKGETGAKVLSGPFFDPPEWVSGQDKTGTLHCRLPLNNFDLYIEKNKDLAFIVYKTYVVPDHVTATYDLSKSAKSGTPELTVDESIQPINNELKEAVNVLLRSKEEFFQLQQTFEKTSELHSPYLFVFHQRTNWATFRDCLAQALQVQMTMLWDFIMENYGQEYAAADASISRGEIQPRYVIYLFAPGDILVQREGDQHLGWIAKSWPQYSHTFHTSRRHADEITKGGASIPLYSTKGDSKLRSGDKVWVQQWSITAWNWEFDGNFQRRDSKLSFHVTIKPKELEKNATPTTNKGGAESQRPRHSEHQRLERISTQPIIR